MALFRRKAKNTVIPEVDQYYEGERRDRAGLAWLLALVSVAVVALVLIGAFLAGRWAYRQITDNDQDDTVSVVEEGENLPSFDGTDDTDDTDGTVTPGTDEDEDEDEGRVDAPARTETPSTPQTPVTGGNEALPQTGPAETVAVFAVVSTAAGAAHYAVTRRRAANY